MATLKQQKTLDMTKNQKCNECRTHKALIHFDIRKRNDKDLPIYRKTCIECRSDTKDDRDLDKKRQAKAEKAKEEADSGIKYCKKCKSNLDLKCFEIKKNGGTYQDCMNCRAKTKKHPVESNLTRDLRLLVS